MKKAFIAALTSALLITALAGVSLVNLAAANFAVPAFGPPLVVTVQLPENKIYTGNSIRAAFTVEVSSSDHYKLDYCTYLLDDEKMSFWPSQVSSGSHSYAYEAILPGLTEGTHKLSIAVHLYFKMGPFPVPSSGVSDAVVFTVNAAAPQVSVVSIRQLKTYNATTLPLDFTVSEPVNWLGYSLDGEAPATIAGNTTLSGLSEGKHTIIVQARDTARSMGESTPVAFSIETQKAAQPQEAQAAPLPTTWVAIAIIASAAAVGLLLYFKKRKR